MSAIRAMRREDLPGVSALYERVVRSGGKDPPDALTRYLERILFDHPWVDEDIPSLVYQDRDGEIVGLLGSHVRRLRMDGRPLRMACSGQLVAAPSTRHRGVGALLTRRYFAGPQDFSITDGANDDVRRMWLGFGGCALAHASIGWTRVFRPGAVGTVFARRRGRRGLYRSMRVLGPALDAAAAVLPSARPGLVPSRPDTTAEVLTAEELVHQTQELASSLRLFPDYDVDYVRWLFGELPEVGRGELVRHLVRTPSGRVAGWYIYYLAHHDISEVLQVAAPAGRTDQVLEHLFWHAASNGAPGLRGRIEPAIDGLLDGRHCLIRRTAWALAHCPDKSILGLLCTPQSLLSRLDGEWWMGPHLAPARSTPGRWRKARDDPDTTARPGRPARRRTTRPAPRS